MSFAFVYVLQTILQTQSIKKFQLPNPRIYLNVPIISASCLASRYVVSRLEHTRRILLLLLLLLPPLLLRRNSDSGPGGCGVEGAEDKSKGSCWPLKQGENI